MAGLSDREHAVLRLAVDEGQITVRQAAERLHVSQAVAGATLRALERAGHLDGQLVGGGEIGYKRTAEAGERLAEITPEPIAPKT